MNGITHRPRSYSIADVMRLLDNQELVPQPKFQRRRTEWPLLAKSHLIDTILQSLPIPTIYVRERRDPTTRRTTREVIDGQQRLRIIQDYMNGKFSLSPKSNSRFAGQSFSDLDYDTQESFKAYELAIELVIGADDKDVLLIFARLNSFSLPLNDQEKLNAEFAGVMKQLIYDLSHEMAGFWDEFRVFSDKDISRMAEVDFISHLFACIIHGHNTPYKVIRSMYRDYDSECDFSSELVTRVRWLFDQARTMLRVPVIGRIMSKPALLHSLLLVLYDLAFPELGKGAGPLQSSRSPASVNSVEASLSKFCTSYEAADAFLEFKQAVRGRTKSALSRRTRHERLIAEVR